MTKTIIAIAIMGLNLPASQACDCKYTANEISALRGVAETMWAFHTCHPTSGSFSRQWFGSEKDLGVEAMVQTYMKACLKAEDICK